MTLENSDMSDYELSQALKKKLTLDEMKELYINTIHDINVHLRLARDLQTKRIKHRYNAEADRSEYYFEGKEDTFFFSQPGNRNNSNEVAIFFKKNIRIIINDKYREYRATRRNYERTKREMHASEYEASMNRTAIVDQSSKESFIEHEYEWFLKNT